MKATYTCEYCSHGYETESEALECEQRHKKEDEEKRRAKEEKAERSKAISNLINLYIQRYGEMPDIDITNENMTKAFNS